MDYFEKTIKTEEIYKGNIIDVEKQTIVLPNGKTATRDIVRHMGASAVVPVTDSGEIYLVKQYRKPLDIVSLEIPAGKLDENEDPRECAIRELKEETGLVAGEIKKILTFHSTPGFSDEIIHIYIATELTCEEASPDEDEFISSRKYKLDDLLGMISTGVIADGKTIAGILFAEKVLKGNFTI